MRSRLWIGSCFISQTLAAFDISHSTDEDLTRFVTRPEIRAPILDIQVHKADGIHPGYWFVAPYANVVQQSHAKNYYQPCQTGPHIYDGAGELIWSGACLFHNQNTFDFRRWSFNNSDYLSGILGSYMDTNDTVGHGFMLDNSFNIVKRIDPPPTIRSFNMHELQFLDNGNRALFLVYRPSYTDIQDLHIEGVKAGFIGDAGIVEMDSTLGHVIFDWWANVQGEVSPAEGRTPPEHLSGPYPGSWDFFHANSIDKTRDGDYILSARFTDTIYKISGVNGSILWRLGGLKSSFTSDFNFSRQHDARWISRDGFKETLSFLDNASDSNTQSANHSSAMLVELDHISMTAKLLSQIPRPDRRLTRLRGNYQRLTNGNSIVCWSENAYISEHDDQGNTLLEARFRSHRFITYRAYKFNFTSKPAEPPSVRSFVYGIQNSSGKIMSSTTVVYVSWNGATEVHEWAVFSHLREEKVSVKLAVEKTTGFETMIQLAGCYDSVLLEAIDRNGGIIGRSTMTKSEFPHNWRSSCHTASQISNNINGDTTQGNESLRRLPMVSCPSRRVDACFDQMHWLIAAASLALGGSFLLWRWKALLRRASSLCLTTILIIKRVQ